MNGNVATPYLDRRRKIAGMARALRQAHDAQLDDWLSRLFAYDAHGLLMDVTLQQYIDLDAEALA